MRTLGICGEGKKIGYSRRFRKPTHDRFTVGSDSQIELSMMGAAEPVRTSLHAETDRDLVLRRLIFHLRLGSTEFTLRGTA